MDVPYAHSSTRHVPTLAKLGCLVGGPLNQLGWLFVGIGLACSWAFIPNTDFSSFLFQRDTQKVPGFLVKSEKTRATERETPIYQHFIHFTYNGQQHQVVSYNTGRDNLDEITVLVPRDHPERAVIQGHRRKLFGPLVSLVILFPLLGLAVVIHGLRRGLRAIALLKRGQLSEATFLRKEDTGSRINDNPVYRVYFEFKTRHGQKYTVSETTHLPERLQDDRQERLLYNPDKPDHAMLIDILPSSPKLTTDNQVEASLGTAKYLIVPFLTILGHGYYVLRILG